MTWIRSAAATAAATLLHLLAASPAAAQGTGFGLNRFQPSERGSEWFVLESLDLRGRVRPTLGVVGEYQYRPLAIYNTDGSVRTAIVSDVLVAHPGASLVLFDRARVGLSVPVQLYSTGDSGTLNGTNYAAPASAQSFGDVRLGGDVRLAGEYGDAITAAVGVQIGLPTGDRDSYAGDGATRLAPRALVAGDLGGLVYAAKLGFEYRSHDATFASSPVGSELFFAGSAGWRGAEKKLVVGPELFGSTVTSGDQLFGRRTTPLEILLGAHYTHQSVRFGGGVGTGLSRGFGTPVVHALLSVEWSPPLDEPSPPPLPVEEPDRDHDGVLDKDDACPDDPGVRSSDPKTNGCPVREKAPEELDRDHDGILDKDDACIDVPGLKTDDPRTNGCPDPDRDKDGILNDADACPDDPGPADKDPARNGCPKAFVMNGQIRILDQVKFKTASAEILPGKESLEVLEAVLKVLTEHADITKVSVEGHTDSRGNAGYNKKLSSDRAASVVKWLLAHGIEAGRLTSAGFGLERPLATNDTDAGRQQNRRVEFHIDEETK